MTTPIKYFVSDVGLVIFDFLKVQFENMIIWNRVTTDNFQVAQNWSAYCEIENKENVDVDERSI